MKIVEPGYEILSPVDGKAILKHIELCGRVCYKSEDKISEGTAQKFVASIIKSGHESVLEHFGISVLFTVDRGVTHELVRHRIASFSQESTRYCNYSKGKFGSEITVVDIAGGIANDQTMKGLDGEEISAIIEEWMTACEDAEKHYFKMLALGASPQIARSVLNNSTKADIVVTMNLREWRHFFSLRTAPAAHPQMREATIPLLRDFQGRIPGVFDDIEEA